MPPHSDSLFGCLIGLQMLEDTNFLSHEPERVGTPSFKFGLSYKIPEILEVCVRATRARVGSLWFQGKGQEEMEMADAAFVTQASA